MSETKFTRGPWEQEFHTNGCVFITSPHAAASRGDVCDLYHLIPQAHGDAKIVTKENARANAHLIAASPDLYEALSTARDIVEKWCHYQGNTKALFDEFLNPIDAALAKARGEQQ